MFVEREGLPMRFSVALSLAALLAACDSSDDSLARYDKKYTQIMVDLAAADRDTTRNVRNRVARKRKVTAETKRVAFFQDKRVQGAIASGLSAAPGSLARVKAEAYNRHAILSSSWRPDEKGEETRLLGRLDELRGVEATWTSPDGEVEVELSKRWRAASARADALPQKVRSDLARHWLEHNMGVVGPDLQELVRLRNRVAVRAGYANYWELALAGQGLTPANVEQIIEELTAVVSPIGRRIEERIAIQAAGTDMENTFANRYSIRRALGMEAARDEADNYFDTDLAEERVKQAFMDMGISADGWDIYTGPRRYTRPGVYGFPVRPPNTIAIVMSRDTRWTMWQYEALAHEGGHAVWWQDVTGATVTSPPLWEPTAPWFEGFAQFFERLVYEPGFHSRYVPELPSKLRKELVQWRAQRTAAGLVDDIVRTQVERRLYEDPNSLEAITRFAAATRVAMTGGPDAPALASGLTYDPSLLSAILWTYPAYSQNYLFSAMTEAWMWEAVSAQVGDPIGNPAVGPLLRDKLIHGDVSTTLADRLTMLHPGDRRAPLRRYLERAVEPEAN
jgi:hypothetical protein